MKVSGLLFNFLWSMAREKSLSDLALHCFCRMHRRAVGRLPSAKRSTSIMKLKSGQVHEFTTCYYGEYADGIYTRYY